MKHVKFTFHQKLIFEVCNFSFQKITYSPCFEILIAGKKAAFCCQKGRHLVKGRRLTMADVDLDYNSNC